jgi:hypothetical protein
MQVLFPSQVLYEREDMKEAELIPVELCGSLENNGRDMH